MKNLFTIKFAGRMRRAEYWSKSILLSLLTCTLLFLGLALSDNNGQFVIIYILTQLSLGLVMMGMTARRLHDVGFSGWMQLWSIIPSIITFIAQTPRIATLASIFSSLGGTLVFVLLLLNSKPGENKYGPNPKEKVRGRTDTDAVKLYLLAAEHGDARAQYNLGVCYAEGEGISRDYTEAVRWWHLAAKQGNAAAQYNLGVCYYNGDGVNKDYTEAIVWYRKAADKGLSEAMYGLGKCYLDGLGVEKDEEQAAKWFGEATRGGFAEAGRMLLKLDPKKAVHIFRKAADAGKKGAMYELGKCYLDGIGVGKDEEEAVAWFQEAADNGHTDAMLELSKCYLEGTGAEKDLEQAKHWLRKAADKGNTDASELLHLTRTFN